MKKIVSALSAVALIAFSFTSCSSNSPEGVVEKFMEATQDNDFEEMIECYGAEGDEAEKMMKILELTNMSSKSTPQLVDYEIGEVKMADDEKSAKVSVKMTMDFNGKEDSMDTKMRVELNDDGDWVIAR